MGFAYTPPFLSLFLSPLSLSTLDIGYDFTPRLLVALFFLLFHVTCFSVIANYQHLVGEVSLQFAGRTNGYCFARLIQAYMTEEDLSNYPEFETFRQIQEEININRL